MPPTAPGESTLADHLEAGPLGAEAVARIGLHACRELAASPLAPSSRRDFCPAAIRLAPSPGGDLEVAIRSPAVHQSPGRSPMYLSPEQVTHASPPDARSDVYSLSMVLYEALSGVLPLPRCATEGELLTTLVTHPPEALVTVAPWLDPELCRVVDRGLQREPSRRWPSPRALGEALQAFTGGSERISADMLAAMTAGERIPRATAKTASAASRRGRRFLPAMAAGGVLLVTCGAWWARRPHPETRSRSRPEMLAPPVVETARLYPKKEVATALLEGPSVFIHLDPRRPGVLVPEGFRTRSKLVLQVGRQLAVPIPDLAVDDAGITATLSFSHAPFLCKIPWAAVYALVDEAGKGQVWAEDIPPEVVAEMAGEKAARDAGPD